MFQTVTESELGWVHSAHNKSPGRPHTARVVPRSWAMLRAWQAGRARMRAAAHSCTNYACQVVTSCPGRDLKQANPGRDLKWGRDFVFPYQDPSQVATSFFPGHDLLDDQTRSRCQPHVVTSLPALSHKSGRDLPSMS